MYPLWQGLTWGFILGPGNPNAAIASRFGAPKGFPPIWSITDKHVKVLL